MPLTSSIRARPKALTSPGPLKQLQRVVSTSEQVTYLDFSRALDAYQVARNQLRAVRLSLRDQNRWNREPLRRLIVT